MNFQAPWYKRKEKEKNRYSLEFSVQCCQIQFGSVDHFCQPEMND